MHFFPAVSTVISIWASFVCCTSVSYSIFYSGGTDTTANWADSTNKKWIQQHNRLSQHVDALNAKNLWKDTHVVDALILCHEYARVVVRSCLEPVWNGDVRHLLPSASLGDHFGQVIVPSKPPMPVYRLPGCSCSGDDCDKHGVYCWSKYRFDLCI